MWERNILHWNLRSIFVHALHECFLYFLHSLLVFFQLKMKCGVTQTPWIFFFGATRPLKSLLLIKRNEFSEYGFWCLHTFYILGFTLGYYFTGISHHVAQSCFVRSTDFFVACQKVYVGWRHECHPLDEIFWFQD